MEYILQVRYAIYSSGACLDVFLGFLLPINGFRYLSGDSYSYSCVVRVSICYVVLRTRL
jgi:hypothetical protein